MSSICPSFSFREAFFEDNPELLGDLHAETEEMIKEKEELEKQLTAAHVELEKQRSEIKTEKRQPYIKLDHIDNTNSDQPGTMPSKDIKSSTSPDAPKNDTITIEDVVQEKAFENETIVEEDIFQDGAYKNENTTEKGVIQDDFSENETIAEEDVMQDEASENETTTEENVQVVQDKALPSQKILEEDSEIIDLDLIESAAGPAAPPDIPKPSNPAANTTPTVSTGTNSMRQSPQESSNHNNATGMLGGESPLALSNLIREIALEFKARVQKDLVRFVNVIVPEPMREPLKKILHSATLVARDAGVKVTDLTKRYLIALIDSTKEVKEDDKQSIIAQ